MGYRTRYTLEVEPPTPTAMRCKTSEGLTLTDTIGNPEISWYKHEADMRRISRRYRGVLFTLRGEGEAQGDLWVRYFRDGKMQLALARIEYDAFDETKLS